MKGEGRSTSFFSNDVGADISYQLLVLLVGILVSPILLQARLVYYASRQQ